MVSAVQLLRFERRRVCICCPQVLLSTIQLLRFEQRRMRICGPSPRPHANLVGRQLLEADERPVDLQQRGAGGRLRRVGHRSW